MKLVTKVSDVNLLSTIILLVTFRSLLGISTSPTPFALNSKSLLLSVVLITLLSSSMLPLLMTGALSTPVILMSLAVISPVTVRFCPSSTLLLGTITRPVPLARNSKSLLLVFVVI